MKRFLSLITLSVSITLLSGCASRPPKQTDPALTELRNLGKHSFKVSTRSSEAQRAFDRGLNLAYSFGYFAAEQEFRRALKSDPECAMAWWGIALVNGPHINFPMVPPKNAARAWEALSNAKARAYLASPLEQALINALSKRYANPQPEDRKPLDVAYADAMRQVWHDYPKNADVGTLCAESLMDLHPWDFWTKAGAQPWTPEIASTLERALELNPNHPGANHLYIHAMEASANPGKAVVAADTLRTLVPGAGHMVHMPAHIYVRVGRWDDAATANRDAMKIDARYRTAYPRPGFYAIYMLHNAHFLAFAAMMQGRSDEALKVARGMVAGVPEDFRQDFAAVADGYMIFVSEVLMRFGRWEEVLAEPQPPSEFPLARALWHFTRTSALTSLNRMDEARSEKTAFDKAAEAVPKGHTFGNNSAADILAIATRVLDGEMLAREGKLDAAIASLREAVGLEDKLRYDEPPDWIQPVRHTLGAVLLKANQPAEAENAYRQDLEKFPDNGWSLLGLRDSLRRQGKESEAAKVDRQLKKSWATADIKPTATCYCQAN